MITYSFLIDEITIAMKALEIAAETNWNNLWLETYSHMV